MDTLTKIPLLSVDNRKEFIHALLFSKDNKLRSMGLDSYPFPSFMKYVARYLFILLNIYLKYGEFQKNCVDDNLIHTEFFDFAWQNYEEAISYVLDIDNFSYLIYFLDITTNTGFFSQFFTEAFTATKTITDLMGKLNDSLSYPYNPQFNRFIKQKINITFKNKNASLNDILSSYEKIFCKAGSLNFSQFDINYNNFYPINHYDEDEKVFKVNGRVSLDAMTGYNSEGFYPSEEEPDRAQDEPYYINLENNEESIKESSRNLNGLLNNMVKQYDNLKDNIKNSINHPTLKKNNSTKERKNNNPAYQNDDVISDYMLGNSSNMNQYESQKNNSKQGSLDLLNKLISENDNIQKKKNNPVETGKTHDFIYQEQTINPKKTLNNTNFEIIEPESIKDSSFKIKKLEDRITKLEEIVAQQQGMLKDIITSNNDIMDKQKLSPPSSPSINKDENEGSLSNNNINNLGPNYVSPVGKSKYLNTECNLELYSTEMYMALGSFSANFYKVVINYKQQAPVIQGLTFIKYMLYELSTKIKKLKKNENYFIGDILLENNTNFYQLLDKLAFEPQLKKVIRENYNLFLRTNIKFYKSEFDYLHKSNMKGNVYKLFQDFKFNVSNR